MGDHTVLYAASLFAAASLALAVNWRLKDSECQPQYPPGQRGYPLIGSVLAVPHDVPVWRVFVSIREKFSVCSTSGAGGLLTKDPVVIRHRFAIP